MSFLRFSRRSDAGTPPTVASDPDKTVIETPDLILASQQPAIAPAPVSVQVAAGGGVKIDRPAGATATPDVEVHAAFRHDQAVRDAMTTNLRSRVMTAETAAQQAKSALSGFTASRLSAAEREHPSYLAPGDDLATAMTTTMNDGVVAMRAAREGSSLQVSMTDHFKFLAPEGWVNVSSLMEYIFKLPSALSGRKRTVYDDCVAEVEAERRIAQITAAAQPPAIGVASVNGGSGASPNGGGDGAAHVAELVERDVGLQMELVTSPEEELRVAVRRRANPEDRNTALQTFELRDGPADVTSYHDFSTLKIAFQPVWTELFDGRLKSMAEGLYQKYVQLKTFAGLPGAAGGTGEQDEPVETPAEVVDLIEKTRRLREQLTEWMNTLLANPLLRQLGEELRTLLAETAPSSGTLPTVVQPTEKGPDFTSGARLDRLLTGLENAMAETYAFDVFAPDSINFGFIVTYRQTWVPETYQVGDLVSTIPLAPKEIRRYTTRKVTKKTRATKELEDNLRTQREDTGDTNRADKEIVDKAQNRTNFSATAHGSFGSDQSYKIDATATQSKDESKDSERTKKEFRENVLKSANEYRHQHRMEVETTESTETEETTFHELVNPNDELTVTYAFYELQRTYRISERIHKLTPVVMVANDVPAPNQIDEAWLMRHDWILRRVILDDSFRPAVAYLCDSFVGAEINISILTDNVTTQRQLVEELRQQVRTQDRAVSANEKAVDEAVRGVANADRDQGVAQTVKSFFDPLGITKHDAGAASFVDAASAMADYAKETRDRADRERARVISQLELANSALQAATDKLGAAVREHRSKLTEIDRLRVHVKENILYYMQAIWSHEPPDQRYFRIYNIDVPVVTFDTSATMVNVSGGGTIADKMRGSETGEVNLPLPDPTIETKKLVEVAELDTLIGFKGNYAIFPLREPNYITLHMMQDYLDVGEELHVRDPDPAGNMSVAELEKLAACLHRSSPAEFEKHRKDLKDHLIKRLTSSHTDDELVIVPTNSLYIEAIVGTHPLLEDFKLIHRALDVKKVQADVRHAELENVRLAARALRGKDEDPDIERKVVVEGVSPQWAIQPDTN